jgi:hypothetical protein
MRHLTGLFLVLLSALAPSHALAVDAAPTGKGVFGVKAAAGKLVSTQDGSPVQLRGANYSSLESPAAGPLAPFSPTNRAATAAASAVQHYSNANLGTYPWWAVPKSWKMNVFRIPLNEASWLRNYTGVDPLNTAAGARQPDVSGNLQAVVKQMVADLTAEGFYVILDLHWSAPGAYLASSQDQLPDADHSIAFWISMAKAFGSNPAVIFDLFNEPYPADRSESAAFETLLDGAPQSVISCNDGKTKIPYSWTSAGMQTLVDAVRNAGAINLLMVAGAGGATDLSGFTTAGGAHFPVDPMGNIAASWHAYGVSSADYTMHNATWSGNINPTAIAEQLLHQGIPVIVGEVGDKSSNGTAAAPVITHITSWADSHGVSVLAWTWNVWNDASGNPGKENMLIKNAAGTPTDGEGAVFKQWLSRH